MMTLTLPQTNGSKASESPQHWLQSSVRAFFSNINWENNPPEVQQIQQNAASSTGVNTTAITLTMTVSQFLSAVNWDNTTIAAPVQPSHPLTSLKPKEITLDDFSDLF